MFELVSLSLFYHTKTTESVPPRVLKPRMNFTDHSKQRIGTDVIHALQVIAKEMETEEHYEGKANVTVNVINVNDNAPVFERIVYIFTVMESISTETVVGRVKVRFCSFLHFLTFRVS